MTELVCPLRLARSLLLLVTTVLVLAVLVPGASAEAIARATLGNGLQVVVVANNLAPMVTLHVNYLVGATESPAGFPGMAHAVEHMMFRGSPGLSGDQINTILAQAGGEANAFTEQSVTQYIATVPNGDLEAMLRLEALRMKGMQAREEHWRLERGAIDQEIGGDLSNPLYRVSTLLMAKLFADTPYAHDALGTVDSFQQTSAAMLKKFHHDWYAPNNAILIVVGDVNPPRTLEMIRKLFGGIPSRPLPARPAVKLKPLTAEELTVTSSEAYGLAVVAYRLPGIKDRDYAAGQVLAAALANPRGKLSDLTEQEHLLGVFFDSNPLPLATGGFAAVAVPVGEDLHQKATLLKKAVAEYVAEGIPAELVAAVKHHAMTDAAADHDSIPDLADAWSQALAIHGYTSPDEELAAILSVTAADVNRVARTWLGNDTAITALLLPGSFGKPAVVAGNFRRTSESFTPQVVRPVRLPAWARKIGAPSAIVTGTVPTDIRLANGLRLIVRPNSTSKLVYLTGRIKHTPNLQTPAGKEGLAGLLDQMMRQGTTSLNRVQFQAALDEIGASVTPGTTFSARVPMQHFEQGVSLLAEALLRPALPAKAFQTLQDLSVTLLVGQQNSPEWVHHHAYLAALYPKGDPALRYETPESVANVTLQDVRVYHAAVFRPDLTTIVITGNIDPIQARIVVERYFATWRGEGPKPETDFPPVPDNKTLSILVPDASRQQADVILAQTLCLNRSHPDYYPFQTGMSVLSGSTASRLYQSLRETRGLVYAVDAEFTNAKTRSLFTVTYGTDPKHVDKVRTLIERNLDNLRLKPVSPAELNQAKKTLIRQLALTGTSTDSTATLLLDLALDDLPLDLPAVAARQIQQVTPRQVQAAFKKWLRPGAFIQVTSGPVLETAEKRGAGQ